MKFKALTSHKQTGSALIIAVFILVVMGILGASLSRMLSSTSSAVAWETLGNRALMAANSAGEMALFELFPPGQALTSCNNITKTIALFPASSGLAKCSANIECRQFDQPLLGSRHYQISATGQCSAGTHEEAIHAIRSIELEARTPL